MTAKTIPYRAANQFLMRPRTTRFRAWYGGHRRAFPGTLR